MSRRASPSPTRSPRFPTVLYEVPRTGAGGRVQADGNIAPGNGSSIYFNLFRMRDLSDISTYTIISNSPAKYIEKNNNSILIFLKKKDQPWDEDLLRSIRSNTMNNRLFSAEIYELF